MHESFVFSFTCENCGNPFQKKEGDATLFDCPFCGSRHFVGRDYSFWRDIWLMPLTHLVPSGEALLTGMRQSLDSGDMDRYGQERDVFAYILNHLLRYKHAHGPQDIETIRSAREKEVHDWDEQHPGGESLGFMNMQAGVMTASTLHCPGCGSGMEHNSSYTSEETICKTCGAWITVLYEGGSQRGILSPPVEELEADADAIAKDASGSRGLKAIQKRIANRRASRPSLPWRNQGAFKVWNEAKVQTIQDTYSTDLLAFSETCLQIARNMSGSPDVHDKGFWTDLGKRAEAGVREGKRLLRHA